MLTMRMIKLMNMASDRRFPQRRRCGTRAFSLVELVIALGIATFVIVSIMGLFVSGLQFNHESEGEIQAANLASLIISSSRATPLAAGVNSPVPTSALTNAFGPVYSNKFVGWDGNLTNSANNAAYAVTCRAGTNSLTGTGVAQVYLMLSWPPQSTSATSPHYYETATYISLH
jgi:type II secretory pathway pseudopilin PulG